jgi:hypothetical protein
MYEMAIAGVPSGTILAVHIQKCSHLSIKQLMPALAVHIIIVHPRGIAFPRALYYIII